MVRTTILFVIANRSAHRAEPLGAADFGLFLLMTRKTAATTISHAAEIMSREEREVTEKAARRVSADAGLRPAQERDATRQIHTAFRARSGLYLSCRVSFCRAQRRAADTRWRHLYSVVAAAVRR